MRKGFWAAVAANLLLVSACTDNTPNDGTSDPQPAGPTKPTPTQASQEREIRGGRVHNVMIKGMSDANSDPAHLIAAVQADLRGRLGAVNATDFVEQHRNTQATKTGARLQFVTMRQTVNGVPIEETYLHVGVRYDATGARLVSSGYRVFENVAVDTRATISHDRAVALAQQSLRLRTPVAPNTDALVIHKLDGHLQLAYALTFPGVHKRSFVIASGKQQGRVVSIESRVFDTNGTVSAPVVSGGAPGGAGTASSKALGNAKVAGGATSVFANATGQYSINVPNGTALASTLNGRASIISDQGSGNLSATGTANGATTDLTFAASSEFPLAQTTAYYYVDQVRTFLEANGMDSALFGAPLATLTNENDTCNAFYSPFDRNINFFRSGGGCNNSAIDTVIAHEYGHFVDDFNGGIEDGGLSEGWGDLLACLFTKTAPVGFDLFPGEAIRSCQNNYIYPPGGFDEVHNLGQAWAGFGWDARTQLIAALGEAQGDALARALILPSFQSNAPDIPNAAREVFLRDDDDGDLSNHTPHWDQLIIAANNHGLAFAIDPDNTAPAPVTNLAITDVKATQVKLTWTATGDDGNVGQAATYDVRWSTQPITAANFAAATPAPVAAPKTAGSPETATITVPPETTIYVAMEVADEQFNTSTLSNVATATTPAGTIVYQEGAEGDTSGWTTTGLWHVTTAKASEGTHSFWYGQESTGNYNTGATNSGDLTSPIIDLSTAAGPLLVIDRFVNVEPDPYDATEVTVIDADDASHTLTFGKDTAFTNGAFTSRVLALTGFDNKRIRLKFHFDTIDSFANSTDGWFVDNLRILASQSTEQCEHGVCEVGPALDPECSTCASNVCDVDSFCCLVTWDSICVAEAQQLCDGACSTCGNGTCDAGETPTSCPQDCTPTCAHDVCEPGVPLDQACDSCATTVCAEDPFCCSVFWDRICVQESETLCGKVCEGCAHDECNVGGPLANNCDACATSVCAADPYCCTTAWDTRCVQEAANGCGLTCETCSHSLCNAGTALENECDPCVTSVCAADPYCCNNTWDQRCVDEAQTTCGLQCLGDREAAASGTPARALPERARPEIR